MAQKTTLMAEDGKQDFVITRVFDLPVELLFRAYVEPDLVEQWMGTKVLKLESKQYGSWQFETTNAQGNAVFHANGVIHEFSPNRKITRTFEMENAPFGVQLEFLEFEHLTDDTSRLHMHVVYRTVAARDQMLQMGIGMAKGVDMAHNRLQDILNTLK